MAQRPNAPKAQRLFMRFSPIIATAVPNVTTKPHANDGNCLVLFGRVHLNDVGGDEDNVVLSIVLMPMHRRSWLSGGVARVKRL